MTKNMLEILKNIDSNKGQVINSLIKSNVLTVKDVVNAAIESKVPSVVWKVAVYTNGLNNEDIEKLVDAIISTGKAYYIYYFALDIKGAPIEKLTDAIIATGNMEYIHLFMQNVPGIPEKYKKMAYPVLERKEKIEDDKKVMAELIKLANNGDLKTIEREADTYRSLLLGAEAEVQEKPKTKVRKTGSK